MRFIRGFFNREYAALEAAGIIWVVAMFYSNALALLVGILILLYYGEYIHLFIEKIFSNEYPYNAIARFTLLAGGLCVIISRIISNQLISYATGFNASIFNNSGLVLTAVLTLIICSWVFSLYGLLVWISRGFATHVSLKMGASALMTGIPLALLTYNISISKSGGLLKFAENVIMMSDFSPNALLDGTRFLPVPEKRYLVRVCSNLPKDYWLSPLESGGYIVAIPRKGYEIDSTVRGFDERITASIFKMIERKDCPETGRYTET